MNPECPRCHLKAIATTKDGLEWYCEVGHYWAVDGAPPVDPSVVAAIECYADAVSVGLTNHLRAAAREYLERLVKELA